MRRLVPFMLLVLGVVLAGCQDTPVPEKKTASQATKDKAVAVEKNGKHEGWWCDEHGIPELECLMCTSNEAELRKNKNWCSEHDYAKDQCFKCKPELREHYAAKFRAKYPGKEPPKPTDN